MLNELLTQIFNAFGGGFDFFRGSVEIAIIAFVIYSVLLFLRGTRGMPVLVGIVLLGVSLTFMARIFDLEVIEWLLMKVWALLAVSVLIIFYPEIRRALAELGSGQVGLRNRSIERKRELGMIADSVMELAKLRIGALIAVERDIGMRAILETGTRIDAPLTRELLTTFFFPGTPLHDGGVIIRDNRIIAAGCIFPLTRDPSMSKRLGTRHRAGLGLSEETDALVIIVSEESGAISLAFKGKLVRGLNRARLERHLVTHLVRNPARRETRFLSRLKRDIEEGGEATPTMSENQEGQ